MQVQIKLARHDDVEPWLELAEEVIPLFGPMPGFDAVLIRLAAAKKEVSGFYRPDNSLLTPFRQPLCRGCLGLCLA
jgi:hypothetical protein